MLSQAKLHDVLFFNFIWTFSVPIYDEPSLRLTVGPLEDWLEECEIADFKCL